VKETTLVGVGTFLPGPPISNERMEAAFPVRADWIDAMIGTRFRHLAFDLDRREAAFSLTDLAEQAARQALARAAFAAEDIDLMVMSTATPDHLMPSTVNVVADRLGMDGIATYEIQAGCAGAVQALHVASALLQEGNFSNALVVSADTSYKFFDLDRDLAGLPASELVNLALFGDGAGAAVMTSSPRASGLRVELIVNRLEGRGRAPGHLVNWLPPGGRAAVPGSGGSAQSAQEDYKAIEERVPRMARELLDEILAATGRSRATVQRFLPPQLGGRITDRIIRILELDPARCINRVAEVGNTGNATPYFQIERLWDELQPGHAAVALAIESSKWIKTGLSLVREDRGGGA
jgi:3-oxoacyl-[acyl-carrier-protein] synthase-3